MKIIKYIIFLLLICRIPLFGVDYYVAPTGDNSDPGTNWATAWSNISFAALQVSAGDTVYVADGTYIGQVTIFSDGTAGSPITFQATNRAVIDCTNGIMFGFFLFQRRNIVINNFICKNAVQAGIHLTGCTNIRVINNICYSNGFQGIMLGGDAFQNIIATNESYANGSYGILLSSDYSNTIIANNIHHNQWGIYANNDSFGNIINNNDIWSNQKGIELNGIALLVPQNNIIISNRIFQNIDPARAGIYLNNADNNFIINNRIEYNGLPFNGGSGISVESGSSGNIINNNVIFSNVGDGIVIRDANNNFITNNNRINYNNRGIFIEGALTGANGNQIINNQISNNMMGGILLDSMINLTMTNIIQNNIICSNGSGITLNGDGIRNNIIRSNDIINGQAEGIFIFDSDNNFIINNKISKNNNGIEFGNTASSNTISNNEISSNMMDGIRMSGGGGGMRGNRILTNYIFTNMMSGISGWDIVDTLIINNYINRNNNTGIELNGSVFRVLISYNWIGTNQNEGIRLSDCSDITFAFNTIVSNNRSGFGMGAVWIFNCSPLVINNTIDNNNSDALSVNGSSSPEIKNNIISSNQGWGINNTGTGLPFVLYNDIIGNVTGEIFNCINTNNNISLPPLYIGGGDYNLQQASPCIGSGEGYEDQGAWPFGFDLVVLKGEKSPPGMNISPDANNVPVLQFKLLARNDKVAQVTNIIVTARGSSVSNLSLEVTNLLLVEDVNENGKYDGGDNILDPASDFGAGTNAALSCNIFINPGLPVYFLILYDFSSAVQGETYQVIVKGADISALTNGQTAEARKIALGNTNIITGNLDHFVIRHDGKGLITIQEKISVTAKDSIDQTIESYNGVVTLYSIEGTPGDTSWSNISGKGFFSNLGGGRALYNFVGGDRGVVTLGITDNTSETIELEVISQSTSETDDDTEGLLVIYPERVHNITKGFDYITIQDALDNADKGDLIRCDEWLYYETITIRSNVTLEATDWDSSGDNTKAVIDGSGGSYTVNILSFASSVTLRGFTIQSSSNSCINYSGKGGEIKGNIIKYSGNQGIYCNSTSKVSIISNTFISNKNSGVYVYNTTARIDVRDNTFFNNRSGISLNKGKMTVITNNRIYNSSWYGVEIKSSAFSNIVINNIIENNMRVGINSDGCNNNFIYNNLIVNNSTTSTGINFNNSSGTIRLNTITNNGIGINLTIGSVPRIKKNNIFNNNSAFDFYNNQANPVDASTNWWGLSLLSNIDARIRDNEEGGGVVTFTQYRLFGLFDIALGADTDALQVISSVSASTLSNNIILAWKSNSGPGFDHYNVYWTTNNNYEELEHYVGISGDVIAYTVATNYIHTTPARGKTNYYYITASDNSFPYTNECWYSAVASAFIIDAISPYFTNISPTNNQINVATNENIVFNILDNDSVSSQTIFVRLDGITALSNGSFSAGYSGSIIATNIISAAGWNVTVDPDLLFKEWTNVNVFLYGEDISGNTNSLSFVFTTTDATAPTPVALIIPPDNTLTNTNVVNMNWSSSTDTGSGITNYEYYITNHLIGIKTNLFLSVTSFILANIPEGTNRWAVRAQDRSGLFSSWSSTNLFIIDLSVPTITNISPASNSATSIDDVPFLWSGSDAITGITNYDLRITNAGAGWSTNLQTSQTNSTLSNLPMGTNYWYVWGRDWVGNTNTSSIWSVVVDTNVPIAILYTPVDRYTNDSTPVFVWSDTSTKSGTSNIIQIAPVNDFSSIAFSSNGDSGFTNCTIASGLTNDLYFWRVLTYKLSTTTWFTSFVSWVYVDTEAPVAVNLLQPGASNVSTNTAVNYTWTSSTDTHSGITNYRVYVTNLTTGWSTNVNGLIVTNINITSDVEGIYNWYVIDYDRADNSAVSLTNIFFIDTSAPTNVILISPTNNTVTNGSNIDFLWQSSTDAITWIADYRLTVTNTTGTWSTNIITANTNSTINLTGSIFNWYVTARDGAGYWSQNSATNQLIIDNSFPIFTNLSPTNIQVNTATNADILFNIFDNITVSSQSIIVRINNTTALSNGSAQAGFSCTIKASNIGWNVLIDPSLPFAENIAVTVYAYANDTAMNTNSIAWQFLTLDSTAPYFTNISPTNNQIDVATNADIIFNVFDNVLILTQGIVVRIDGQAAFSNGSYQAGYTGSISATNISSSTGWNVKIDQTALFNEWTNVDLYIYIEDASGNTNSMNFSFKTADPTSPTLVSLLFPNNNKLTNTNSIGFVWSPSTDTGSGITNYRLKITNSKGAGWSTNLTVLLTNQTVNNLPEGTNYWYVWAEDKAGNIGALNSTNIFVIDMSAPGDVNLIYPDNNRTTNTSTMNFIWNKALDAFTSVTNYEIEISTNNFTGTWSNIIISATNYQFTGLNLGTNQWRVRAIDKLGNIGPWSLTNIFIIFPSPPLTPLILSNTAVSTNEIALIWENVSNETGYTLFRSMTNNINTAAPVTNMAADITNHNDIGLSTNTMYYYWVKAYNTGGESPFSSVSSNKTWPPLPAAPTILSINAVSTDRIDLIWENAANETNYTLFRSMTNDTNTATFVTNTQADVTNHNDIGLKTNTMYYYWVKAYNITGESGYSISASNRTLSTIKYEDNLDKVRVYPVPCFQNQVLKIDNLTQEVKIRIYSVTGILVMEKEINNFKGVPIEINLSDHNIASGVYIIIINNNKNKSINKKIIYFKGEK